MWQTKQVTIQGHRQFEAEFPGSVPGGDYAYSFHGKVFFFRKLAISVFSFGNWQYQFPGSVPGGDYAHSFHGKVISIFLPETGNIYFRNWQYPGISTFLLESGNKHHYIKTLILLARPNCVVIFVRGGVSRFGPGWLSLCPCLLTTLEVTQGQILSQSPTDATSSR